MSVCYECVGVLCPVHAFEVRVWCKYTMHVSGERLRCVCGKIVSDTCDECKCIARQSLARIRRDILVVQRTAQMSADGVHCACGKRVSD